MELTIHIPDEIAGHYQAEHGDLSRRVLETFALDEFKSHRITRSELRRLLGFETGYEVDAFLKAHHVYEDYSLEDFEREREALRGLGF
jgi:hypothetical protein